MIENLKRYTPGYTLGTMRVIKTNGIQGYVKFSELDEAFRSESHNTSIPKLPTLEEVFKILSEKTPPYRDIDSNDKWYIKQAYNIIAGKIGN